MATVSVTPGRTGAVPLTRAQLERGIDRLPALSVTVLEALALIDRGEVDFAALETVIGQDQSLAARLLRVANSPFYGFAGHVGSVREACVVLGVYSVRHIVTAAGVLERFPPGGAGTFDRLAFWQHAIGTAVAARVLARHRGQDAELAFTAGLLHDLGKLVLDAHFPEAFAAVLRARDERDCLLREAEEAVLGFDHAWIGAKTAERWGLPAPIVEAIARHHAPNRAPVVPLADLVHVADVVCRGLEIGDGGDSLIPALEAGAMQRLGLSLAALRERLAEIEEGCAASSLLIDTPGG